MRREILHLQVAMYCFVYYINTHDIPKHFNFTAKGTIYYVTIAMVMFSHVLRYHVFPPKLTWYFMDVYIINKGYWIAKKRTGHVSYTLQTEKTRLTRQ